MWSAALGYPIALNRRYIDRIFHQFAGSKESFDFQNFKQQMEQHPDLLAWFSKPEEAMNQRLYHHIDETQGKKRVMLEQIETMQVECMKYFDEIGRKLEQCMQIFEDDQSFEDIQMQIKKFQFEVQKHTSQRLTINEKNKLKNLNIDNNDFNSRKSNYSRLSSVDRQSIIDFSANHSPN